MSGSALWETQSIDGKLIKVDYINTHITPDKTNKLHCHPFFELIIIDRGEVKYTKNNSMTEIKNKAVVFNRIYDIHNPFVSYSPLYKRIKIQFSHKLLEKYIKPSAEIELALGASYIKSLNDVDFERIFSLSKSIFQLCGNSEEELEKTRVCLYLATLILNCYDATPLPADSRQSYVNGVREYIIANLSRRLTIEDIAGTFFVSKTKLICDFKRYSNLSVLQFITAERVKAAQRLLMKGYSVSSTAEKCGFSSSSYFIKVFSQTMGITPLKYSSLRLEGSDTNRF